MHGHIVGPDAIPSLSSVGGKTLVRGLGVTVISSVASTITQTGNEQRLIRSHTPIHGVGRFACTFGAPSPVSLRTPPGRSSW